MLKKYSAENFYLILVLFEIFKIYTIAKKKD